MSNGNVKNKSNSPTKPRKKDLTINSVKKKVKQINTLSEYVIDRERNEVLKYYDFFDEKKIRELLLELQQHLKYDAEKGENYFKNDEVVIQYLQYLIFKYFTKIHEQVGSDFEENKEVFDYFDSLGYIWLFHEKIFNPEEVVKVFKRFYTWIELVNKQIELDEEAKQKLVNIQNKDILFKRNKIIPEV